MIGHEFDWLAERARTGDPAGDAYGLDEAYPGERADLVRELHTALAGCPDARADKFAVMMQAAVNLNALPVLRAVVSLWRSAYRDLLDQIDAPTTPYDFDAAMGGDLLLTPEECARLAAFKRGLRKRQVRGQ